MAIKMNELIWLPTVYHKKTQFTYTDTSLWFWRYFVNTFDLRDILPVSKVKSIHQIKALIVCCWKLFICMNLIMQRVYQEFYFILFLLGFFFFGGGVKENKEI